MCCRTSYSHPCGVVAVKNMLFTVKHVFAAHPNAPDTRTSSTGPVACYIERENKGLSGMESFLFLGMIFQHSTKSFPFGVLGWPRREWAIKLMNGRFHSFAKKKNKTRILKKKKIKSLRKLLLTNGDTCFHISIQK